MINGSDSTCMHCTYVEKLQQNYGTIHDCLESRHNLHAAYVCGVCAVALMSHRSNVVVIAGNRITAQGMDAVVDALKSSHCIAVLDVGGLY